MEWKEHKSEKGTPQHPELLKKMAEDFANATPVSTEIATQCLKLYSEIIQATSNQILL